MSHEYTMDALSELVDLPVRTIRFYIQKGLVDRPVGARKTARYLPKHVEQCLKVKRWSDEGLSLDRIAQAMVAPPTELPPTLKKVGALSVTSRIHLAEGVELAIDHDLSSLSQSQVRALAETLLPLVESFTSEHESAASLQSESQGDES
jgi:DNA-binding transcriptional MerR regulator